jgi:hypothetical protein
LRNPILHDKVSLQQREPCLSNSKPRFFQEKEESRCGDSIECCNSWFCFTLLIGVPQVNLFNDINMDI